MSYKDVQAARYQLRQLLRGKPVRYISQHDLDQYRQAAMAALPARWPQRLRLYSRPHGVWLAVRVRWLLRRAEAKRQAANKRFVRHEAGQHGAVFNDINGYPLDAQQRHAVVTDEDNNLVIAGAGSGKTLTVVGKIRYLVQVRKQPAGTILVISFTRKSAESLRERLGVRGVRPQTFHAFALQIIRQVEGRQPRLHDDNHNDELFRSIVMRLAANQRYAAALRQFLGLPAGRALGNSQVAAFTSLAATFLALHKGSGDSLAEVRRRLEYGAYDKAFRRRARHFLQLYGPVLDLYGRTLAQAGRIDFHDMINRAVGYVNGNRYRSPYEYVIIDEFQDLSAGRARLLQALRRQQPGLKLFCVGDDWQSIFRFAGSDVGLFNNFREHFGATAVSRIETTYRFNQPMIGTSSGFILSNPAQTSKHLRAPAGMPASTYSFVDSQDQRDDTVAVLQALRELAAEYGLKPDSQVYIVGRYGFDLQRLQARPGELDISGNRLAYHFPAGNRHAGRTVQLEFITAHRSKGLEADYVIVINCNGGRYGFPSGQADDPLLGLVLSTAEAQPYAEERRLFYVAMTRARRHTVFIAGHELPSPFIRELRPPERTA